MIKIGRNNYIEGDLTIETNYDEPTLSITIYQMDSINETATYDFKLLGTYTGQTTDLIGDAIFMYERDKNKNRIKH